MEHMQKYEVIRMIERDGGCHIAMDCAEGTLLIYRVQKGDILDKHLVLSWIRGLVRQLELYHRCGAKQSYRYLNPYSVLITRDEKVLLLDLQAEQNEFVIRNLQKRAMRNHFVKPVLQMREDTRLTVDLYSLGKTIQFLLACTEVTPSYTQFEEYRLSKCVQKCLESNSKKKYENLKQIQKDIPKCKKIEDGRGRGKKLTIFVMIILFITGIQIVRINWFLPEESQQFVKEPKQVARDSGEGNGMAARETMKQQTKETVEDTDLAENIKNAEQPNNESPEYDFDKTGETGLEMEALRQAFLENTKAGNEAVIHDGELLKSELLYYLAMAYDREGMIAEAIAEYGLLCTCSCETSILEQAFYRKITLELESMQWEQAKETCEKGIELLPESEKIKEKYEELQKEEWNEETSQETTKKEEQVQVQ
ncbi:MAG: hypothetical protein HFH53_10470 [Hespellia sp.]|nr:hypothetical protein [Hespellia sp.]